MLDSLFLFHRYYIDEKSDVDHYFAVDPTEGTISTNELLDRESTAQFNISIIASKISKYCVSNSISAICKIFLITPFKRATKLYFFHKSIDNTLKYVLLQKKFKTPL